MAAGGGLAQQVAEKLADLIQVREGKGGEHLALASPLRLVWTKLFDCFSFSAKFMKVAEGKVPLEVDEVGGWLDVR